MKEPSEAVLPVLEYITCKNNIGTAGNGVLNINEIKQLKKDMYIIVGIQKMENLQNKHKIL